MKMRRLKIASLGGFITALALSVAAEKVQLSEVPLAAQNTIRAHAGGAPIEDIDKMQRDGRTIYEAAFKKQGEHTELQVFEDGTLVNAPNAGALANQGQTQEYTGAFDAPLSGASKVSLEQVPEAAQRSIRAHAGTARVEDIDKGQLNGKTVYQAAFKREGQHVELRVAENGEVINASGMRIHDQLSGLPQPVQQTIQRELGDVRILDIDRESIRGQTFYEVEFLRQGRFDEMHISESGAVLRSGRDLTARRDDVISREASGEKVSMNELPRAAQNTIRAQAGRSPIEDIDRRVHNGQVVYEAAFKRGDEHREVLVSEDGRLLDVQVQSSVGGQSDVISRGGASGGWFGRSQDQNNQTEALHELPVPAQRTIRAYAGHQPMIRDIDQEQWEGRKVYEIEFDQESRRMEMVVDEEGRLLELRRRR